MKLLFLPLALLSACGQPTEAPRGNEAMPAELPTAAAPAPKAFVFDEKNELIEFHFGWSAEAAAVPQLVARFQGQLDKRQAELVAGAREDKAMRDKEGYDFNGHMSSTDYKTVGQSDRLLSLEADVGSYTGGAHGNYGTAGLIWDRAAAKEIKFADLFTEAANMDRLLTGDWCNALNKERQERRGEPIGTDDMFDQCPNLREIAIIPADKDRNGKFERLMLVADPYVAGPYVEGSYEIELGVPLELSAVLKRDYRPSFEVRQTQ